MVSALFAPGEYGQLTCPLPKVEWGYDGDGDTYRPEAPERCGANLHLDWSLSIPVYGDTVIPEIDVGGWAMASMWEVVCENGHTLARSSAEESAEPFNAASVLLDAYTRAQPEPA